MANIQTQITLTHAREVIQTIKSMLLKDGTMPKEEARSVRNYFNALIGSERAGKFSVQVNSGDAVQASGTITFSSLANNDTITVGSVTFTAKTSGASGTTQFNLGGSDTNAAVNAAAKIIAHPDLLPFLSATAATGVITIKCLVAGKIGNLYNIAISAHGSVSGSGNLASGANATTYSTTNNYTLGV